MHVGRTAQAAAAVALLVSVWCLPAAGQSATQEDTPRLLDTVYGPDLFRLYCASCHGRDGKGEGPVASSLRTTPPDLTLIATRNGGAFPTERIETLVSGDGDDLPPTHGTRDMPVWGPILRLMDPNDRLVKVRISNLVKHLESIQAM